ncbi:hypothetical protein SAMN05421881_10725 [Nitrosomonas halophila]|uniref:Uncharacterized protein n=1 Tax=Nitrosomonas halophila TaxID=44576 RepID=A0A1H3NFE9_9PROT|nr:hypothetical protein SAMN05421881_10725 [Nitrosomonas halophila]
MHYMSAMLFVNMFPDFVSVAYHLPNALTKKPQIDGVEIMPFFGKRNNDRLDQTVPAI